MLSAAANSIIRDKSKFNNLTNDICLLYIFTLFQLSSTQTMVLYDLLGIVEKCFPGVLRPNGWKSRANSQSCSTRKAYRWRMRTSRHATCFMWLCINPVRLWPTLKWNGPFLGVRKVFLIVDAFLQCFLLCEPHKEHSRRVTKFQRCPQEQQRRWRLAQNDRSQQRVILSFKLIIQKDSMNKLTLDLTHPL